MKTSLFTQNQPVLFGSASQKASAAKSQVIPAMAADRLELSQVRFGDEKPSVDAQKLKTMLRLSHQPWVQAKTILEVLKQPDNGLSKTDRIDLLIAAIEAPLDRTTNNRFYQMLTEPIYVENPDMEEVEYLARQVSTAGFRLGKDTTRLLLAHMNDDQQTVRNILAPSYAEDRYVDKMEGLLKGGVSQSVIKGILPDLARYGQTRTVQLLLKETKGLDKKTVHHCLENAARNGHEGVVAALLETGLVDKPDLNMAMSTARERRYKSVAKLLKAHRQATYPSPLDKLAMKLRESGNNDTPEADKPEE